jgi:hypothetical protein
MKPYIFISFFVILLCPFLGRSQVLYPPLNLQGEGIECSVYLTWEKPELPGGGTPPGLLGYNVYKEGDYFAYVSGQDTVWYYDIDPPPCPSNYHSYCVTAYYDLTSYGYPGQFGESGTSDTVTVAIFGCGALPFTETWDQASFSYNGWSIIPSQGNWNISVALGLPPPVSVFSGNPVATDYNFLLKSQYMPTLPLSGCTDLFLDFDLKLDNMVNSGTEQLKAEYYFCNTVDTVVVIEFSNSSGFDWTHYRFNINDARQGRIEIGFRATGQNSSNIQQWLVDNICVSFKCKPPVNLTATHVGNIITLLWDPPVCDGGTSFDSVFAGYNVYMSDSLGNPPFHKFTAAPCTDDSIVINLVPGWDPEVVRFYVTDLQNGLVMHTFLCESEPSDTVSAHFVGIDPLNYLRCNIYPNPNDGEFTADLPPDAVSVEISDLNSRVIYSDDLIQNIGRQFNIDISGHPKGVYILTVTTKTGISRGKIVLY